MNWTLPNWVVIYPTPCYNLSKGAGKWPVLCKDNWIPYRVYLRAISEPPLKGRKPPQTGICYCEGEIFRPPETASIGVRGLNRHRNLCVYHGLKFLADRVITGIVTAYHLKPVGMVSPRLSRTLIQL
ncbi:hypothetical protein AVEN_275625-1 [Araneus ventricosus]|uniref:Uncharacterized protein n=1 Tax=Araneus ventricosus TaxID=182803 RepID=A0A4Y2K8K5_ARAVE|nr:hypothetical protein AVEN_275625-1 [Araneus ventricosus]